jgi:hypothetical protein
MSVFSFEGGAGDPILIKITSSTVTDIVDATSQVARVVWLAVGENNGGTPNLTVEIYDATTSFYLTSGGSLWNAKAMTAKQGVLFDDGYVIPIGSKLRVTSSDASGRMDVTGIYILETPTAPR